MGKYEEALERARRGKPIDEVFPELKESEDERIRKQIEQAIIEHDWSVTYKVSKDDCLAYLERQKEHHYTKRNDLFDKCVENCDSATMKEVSDNVDAILQKEQKPADDKAFEEWIDGVWKHNKVNNPDSYDKGDEIQFDEQGFKAFCHLIRKMNQQKPAEWSTDDLKMIGIAISFIEQFTSRDYILGVNKLDVIVWLKALRSGTTPNKNSHWKPSEEQLTELRHAISGCSYDIEPLVEIEEHLKKLM